MEQYQKEEEKLSRLNAAGLINVALEKLWGESYNAMAQNRFLLWNKRLDSIWVILGGDEPEEGDKDEDMKTINKALYKLGSLSHKQVGFELIGDKEKINMAAQYLNLMKKSLFLRRLQNTQGKGTAYASDDDDDLD